MKELARIKEVYEKRSGKVFAEKYSLFRPGELYLKQSLERVALSMLRREGVESLEGLRILEVGCGRGQRLADFQRWGAAPDALSGIELFPAFAARAAADHPAYGISQASAHRMPFAAATFDIVAQFTVFTSLLDAALRVAAAREMLRVLRPGGCVLWYDFRYPNPWNADVRPVHRLEIRRLFPGCSVNIRSVTLLPPLARRLAPLSTGMCALIEALPFMRSHYIAIIRPQPREN